MADCSAFQTYRQFIDSKQELKGEVLIIFLYKFGQNVTKKETTRIIETNKERYKSRNTKA